MHLDLESTIISNDFGNPWGWEGNGTFGSPSAIAVLRAVSCRLLVYLVNRRHIQSAGVAIIVFYGQLSQESSSPQLPASNSSAFALSPLRAFQSSLGKQLVTAYFTRD